MRSQSSCMSRGAALPLGRPVQTHWVPWFSCARAWIQHRLKVRSKCWQSCENIYPQISSSLQTLKKGFSSCCEPDMALNTHVCTYRCTYIPVQFFSHPCNLLENSPAGIKPQKSPERLINHSKYDVCRGRHFGDDKKKPIFQMSMNPQQWWAAFHMSAHLLEMCKVRYLQYSTRKS